MSERGQTEGRRVGQASTPTPQPSRPLTTASSSIFQRNRWYTSSQGPSGASETPAVAPLTLRPWADTVPAPPAHSDSAFSHHLSETITFVRSKKRLVVLTGAGMSTESSLPDYRSPQGSYSKGHKPITFQEFAKSEATRQRYWARSFLGWSLFAASKPNAAHFALTQLEALGALQHIITQNVDYLHQKAGSQSVLELHGTLHHLICTSCHTLTDRREFQNKLIRLNPAWYAEIESKLKEQQAKGDGVFWQSPSGQSRADGDMEPSPHTDYSSFHLPSCHLCNGFLKPNVVMFGENVPRPVAERSFALVEGSDGLLVLGTSLQVFSIYRLVRRAQELGIPYGIVNIGPTRGDEGAAFKYQHRLGPFLSGLASNL